LPAQTSTVYTPAFFDSLTEGTRESARTVIPAVIELLQPASVLDVGCGTGTWLSEWRRAGLTDITGIDGDYVDRAALQLTADQFVPADLRKPFSLGRKFDLVQSFEVAEHLEEPYADAFVQSLTEHGETILFSAAVPGQGGTHHVNEQWPSYWAEKFAKAGYTAYDVIRPRFWTDPRVVWWYKQNILLFARGRELDGEATTLDVVHPEMYRDPVQILRGVPEALKTIVLRKLRLRPAAFAVPGSDLPKARLSR
jgi:SAM-dependent methyltransferase